MATYDEAIKALEAVDNGADLVAAIVAKNKTETEAEKTRGITEKKKVDNEAKGLRERLKKVTEPLGLDPESEDFDTQVGEYKTLKEKGPQKANVKADPEYLALKKQSDETARKLEEREKKDQAARDKTVKAMKKVALAKVFTENNIDKDHTEDLMVSLDARLQIDDDDNMTWKGDAEGEVFSVEDGFSKWLEKPGKKKYVTNSQNPGGGGGPGAGGGNGSPKKEPSVEDRRKELATLTRSGI